MIKLDAMESPHSPSPELKAAFAAALSGIELNRYPDPGAAALKEAIRRRDGLKDGEALVLGNGSDELIQLLLLACCAGGGAAAALSPSFVMYRILSAAVGAQWHDIPLERGFALGDPVSALRERAPRLLFVASPNNPTGNRFGDAELEALADAVSPGWLVVDEAYRSFASGDASGLMRGRENVLLMRTFSKAGFAGLRLGYLVARAAQAAELEKLRLPYNIGACTQALAAAALEHAAEIDGWAAAVRAERSRLSAMLAGLKGVEPYPSEANFVLSRMPDADAAFDRLLKAKILVKNLNGHHPLLENCLRITVGLPAENDAVAHSLAGAADEEAE